MKTILIFLGLSAAAAANAQYTISNFWGPYAPEIWQNIGDVSFAAEGELALTGTTVEIYGGGGGCWDPLECPDQILAEASIVVGHGGTLHLDYSWDFFTPGCMDRKMFKNGLEVSLYTVKTSGLAVTLGDYITFQVVWYPWEADCESGNWTFVIRDWRIEFETLPPPVCPPTPDLDGNGIVGVPDLLLLLAEFGAEM